MKVLKENMQFLNKSGKSVKISKKTLKSLKKKNKRSWNSNSLISKENCDPNKKVSVNKKISKKTKKNINNNHLLKRVKNLKIFKNYIKEESAKNKISIKSQDTSLSTKLDTPFKFGFSLENPSKTNENFKISKYIKNILNNLKKSENKKKEFKNVNFSQQNEITEKMRTILINWIIMVHKNFRLKEDTLFLAITIIDRYTAKNIVKRKNYQLLGITSLYIASKFEEIYPPKLNKFVCICDKAFLKSDIISYEAKILKSLDFRICVPTSYYFLNSISHLFSLDAKTVEICTYFLYLSFYEYKCFSLKENLKCLVSLYFALRFLNKFDLFEKICCLEFFQFEDFEFHQTTKIFEILSNRNNHLQFSAIRKKFGNIVYSNHKNM